jgi:hypothetical protein
MIPLNPSSPFEDIAPAAPSWAAAEGGDFTCGVDLGRSFDPTAVAIIRKVGAETGHPIFQCGYLTRLPLDMTYPAQVAQIKALVGRLRGSCEIVIDHTGVGKAVADIFQLAGMATVNVTITGGDVTTQEGLDFHVPKLNLVAILQSALHQGQLKIARGLADAQSLVEELQNFQSSVTDGGTWRFGARGSSKHDDLVLALAIAVWRSAGDVTFSNWGLFEYMRQTYGPGNTDKELTALPKPLEPLPPEEPPNFGYEIGAPKAQLKTVMLKPPAPSKSPTGLWKISY